MAPRVERECGRLGWAGCAAYRDKLNGGALGIHLEKVLLAVEKASSPRTMRGVCPTRATGATGTRTRAAASDVRERGLCCGVPVQLAPALPLQHGDNLVAENKARELAARHRHIRSPDARRLLKRDKEEGKDQRRMRRGGSVGRLLGCRTRKKRKKGSAEARQRTSHLVPDVRTMGNPPCVVPLSVRTTSLTLHTC